MLLGLIRCWLLICGLLEVAKGFRGAPLQNQQQGASFYSLLKKQMLSSSRLDLSPVSDILSMPVASELEPYTNSGVPIAIPIICSGLVALSFLIPVFTRKMQVSKNSRSVLPTEQSPVDADDAYKKLYERK